MCYMEILFILIGISSISYLIWDLVKHYQKCNIQSIPYEPPSKIFYSSKYNLIILCDYNINGWGFYIKNSETTAIKLNEEDIRLQNLEYIGEL